MGVVWAVSGFLAGLAALTIIVALVFFRGWSKR